jgi:predicted enzyme related to lactoylglutathione lyase
MGNPVVHFEVVGKDGEKLKGFYSDLFGWKINSDNPMNYGIIDRESNVNSEGVGIGGGISSSQDGQPHSLFYVEVDDIPATLEKAEGLGGKTFMPAMDVMEGLQIGIITDPEGNLVGLVKSQRVS